MAVVLLYLGLKEPAASSWWAMMVKAASTLNVTKWLLLRFSIGVLAVAVVATAFMAILKKISPQRKVK